MTKRNPKQEGSNLFDCRPQTGPCPLNCNQCFYNRPGAFYVPINEPDIPTVEEVGDGIVRMNCGHDSNIHRELVIKTAQQYKHFFFNTSIPRFDFPGPVVFTANPKEEELLLPSDYLTYLDNLQDVGKIMFVRLRVSASNLYLIEDAIKFWTQYYVPVVLTFMAYYEKDKLPGGYIDSERDGMVICKSIDSERPPIDSGLICCYEYKIRHINSYWCPTKEFMAYVLKRMKRIGGRLVTMCGTLDSNYCRDCGNCEQYYFQTLKHIKEGGVF